MIQCFNTLNHCIKCICLCQCLF